MLALNSTSAQATMTSIEVEDYLKTVNLAKLHKNILQDVKKLKDFLTDQGSAEGSADLFKIAEAVEGTWTDSQGKQQPMYTMNEKFVLLLISGYDVRTRLALIDKVEELHDKIQNLAIQKEYESIKALDLDALLVLRDMTEEHDFAQEYLTAYLAECKLAEVKPVSVLSKQRAYVKQALQNRKDHQKSLARVIDAGLVSGKSMKAIRDDLMATKPRKIPLKNLTLSKHQLMALV